MLSRLLAKKTNESEGSKENSTLPTSPAQIHYLLSVASHSFPDASGQAPAKKTSTRSTKSEEKIISSLAGSVVPEGLVKQLEVGSAKDSGLTPIPPDDLTSSVQKQKEEVVVRVKTSDPHHFKVKGTVTIGFNVPLKDVPPTPSTVAPT